MAQQREIPSAAKVWGLRKHTTLRRKTREDGKPYHANVTSQMKGVPDPETGELAERWPVAAFSVKRILEQWGPGRYSVDWYDKAGKRIDNWRFDVGEPPAASKGPGGAAPAAASDDEPTSRLRGLAANLDGGGVIELMLLLQSAGDAAAARARAEADRAADRDRAWFQQVQETQREMLRLQPAAAAPAAAAGASQEMLQRELALMRREMLLQLREDGLAMRAELAAQRADDDDDQGDGAETMGEAVNKAGVAGVEAMGEVVPDIVSGLLGKLQRWLAATGQPSDPATIKALVEAAHQAVQEQGAAAHTNGAG